MYFDMHGKYAEFGNLIPGKLCFWREIFCNLEGKLYHLYGYFCLYLKHLFANLYKIHIFDGNIDHISGKCLLLFSALFIL